MAHPNTPIERMLRVAQLESEKLLLFHRKLLASEVLVPVLAPPDRVRRGTVPAGELLNVITLVRADGVEALPFFTSPEKVFRWQPTDAHCLVMYVRELFESRPDMHFCLNPTSPEGREFTPTEAQALLVQR
jgi:hypothetical protein